MIIPVILAGGSGTRLWPLSRALYPKQLLSLVGEHTMLQNTLLRLKNFEGIGDPIVLCNHEHRFMVAEQLRSIHVKPASIVLEPMGRNTAPAVTVAALTAMERESDSILLVLPADHNIDDVSQFHKALQTGEYYARQNYLITFGILPGAPETGYGYIRKGAPVKHPVAGMKEKAGHENLNDKDAAPLEAFKIDKFVEKPDRATAEQYLDSGKYCWNSGMFMFKAGCVLDELNAYTPSIVKACENAFQQGKEDLDFFRLDADSFEVCPQDSIDYAVMEKTEKGVMVPFEAGWNDLGSWDALWQVGEKDANGNVCHGDILMHDVRSSYLYAHSRMIAAVGLENHIVVETSDAVLISPRNRVQDVKHLVNRLKAAKRDEARLHRRVFRPWGSYENINCSERFQVKRIVVKPGAQLSLQKHFHRAEHWVIVRGTAIVTKGSKEFLLKEDESIYIPLGVEHRLMNPGKIPLELIEVQSGSYLGEDDIVRFEDIYNR